MTKRPLNSFPRAQQAGILCGQEQFRSFVAARLRMSYRPDDITPTAAAEFVRGACGVASRADLNTNAAAAAKFDALRTDFDAWRGKIPAQR